MREINNYKADIFVRKKDLKKKNVFWFSDRWW